MSDAPGYPTVSPYLLYEDAGAAVDWLCQAFGFRERLRYADEGGVVTHAELEVGSDGLIMVGHPGPDYRSPDRLGATTGIVHVYVDDVDAHYRRAREAGVRITREPQDEEYGDRRYDCKDLEGHDWSFAQILRHAPPEEWGATAPG
jgi:PhnB protein